MSVGETLKKARENKQLSLEEISRQTHIPTKVLSALEEEAFANLAGPVYVKSFLKKYAEFLGLNSTEILNIYLSTFVQPLSSSTLPIQGERKVRRKEFLPRLVLKLILFFFLFLFLIFLAHTLKRLVPQRLKGEKKTLSARSGEPLLIPLSQGLTLKVKAKKDTWLQVKVDGEVVFQHILKAGTEETWKAKNNFELWVAEGRNLNLALNERPLGSLGKGVKKGIIVDH
ncbi:MAG: helix-turn-helix domain-containing protein, partial [Candidatus Omnitrophica bacterium]|nr:helix-turn-helix domain-containing protein [Candidatus Omnitrophota bacterium]